MRDYIRLRRKLRKADQESLVQILRNGVQQVRRRLARIGSIAIVGWRIAAQGCLFSVTLRRRRFVRSGSATWKPAWISLVRPPASRCQSSTESCRAAADHHHGVQRPAGRTGTLDRTADRGGRDQARKSVPQVGRETVRVLLESHDLKPWRKKCGAWPSWMRSITGNW